MALKIGFLGLDAAGKTTFLAALGKTYGSIIDAKPTKGIERSEKNVMGQAIGIWDYGGQTQYRDRYLKSERDLEGLDLVFYLLDVQNPTRFDEAADYLSNLLDKMKGFNQENLIICFHKYDPDRSEQLKDQLNKAWEKMESIAEDAYAFLPTSIFDEKQITRAFSMGLRKVATKKEIVEGELQKIIKDAGAKASVVLTTDGYAIAAYAADDKVAEEIEGIGMSLAILWQSSGLKFQEVVGKLDIGDFSFETTSAGGRDYYILNIGVNDRPTLLGKIQSILETIS